MMWTLNFTLAASNAGTGLLLIFLGLPLLKDKVGRNAIYGVRIPKSLESDENWYAINRYGGAQMIRWGWWLVLAGLITLVLPLAGNMPLTFLIAFLPAVFGLVLCVQTVKFSQNL